jgi:hypothetical protein
MSVRRVVRSHFAHASRVLALTPPFLPSRSRQAAAGSHPSLEPYRIRIEQEALSEAVLEAL